MRLIKKENFLFCLFLFTFALIQLYFIFPSGLYLSGEMGFWGVQYHDGLWHVSLAQKLASFSLENPVYSGETVRNYHYLSNLFIAFIHNISGIGILDVTYRIYPLVIAFCIGIFTYKLSFKLFKSKSAAIWSMFFVTLGSNFAYLLPLFKLGSTMWESSFWVQQPISIFSNIPFATSLAFSLIAFYSLFNYLMTEKKKYFWLTILFFSILPGTKSFSIIFLGALGLVGGLRMILKKKSDLLVISVLSALFAFLIILPTFKFERHLIFEPGWYLRTMIEAPDRMNWQDWALRYQLYKNTYDIFNLTRFFVIAFLIFFFGNLGTRIVAIGIFPKLKELLKNEVNQILMISVPVFALIPMFYLTTGIAWNSIQFWYYFIFIVALYSGYGTYLTIQKIKRNYLKYIFGILIILLTIPVDIYSLKFFWHKPDSVIKAAELTALDNLAKIGKPNDVVFTYPIDSSFIEVSALTGKSMFLGDWLMTVVPGHDYEGRLNLIKDSMQTPESFRKLLSGNRIKWLYIKGSEPEIVSQIKNGLSVFYKSDEVTIYHVEKI